MTVISLLDSIANFLKISNGKLSKLWVKGLDVLLKESLEIIPLILIIFYQAVLVVVGKVFLFDDQSSVQIILIGEGILLSKIPLRIDVLLSDEGFKCLVGDLHVLFDDQHFADRFIINKEEFHLFLAEDVNPGKKVVVIGEDYKSPVKILVNRLELDPC